jgi:hypothetical protein
MLQIHGPGLINAGKVPLEKPVQLAKIFHPGIGSIAL